MKKAIFALVVISLALMACGNTNAVVNTASNTSAARVSEVALQVPQDAQYEGLDSGKVTAGNGVVATIELTCGCSIKEFENVGLIVERGTTQVLYIPDIRTLNNMGLFDNSMVFTAHPGDVVYFGKVKTAAKYATSLVLRAVTDVDASGREMVTLSGGNLVQPIFIGIADDRSTVYVISGGSMFANVSSAFEFASK